MYMYVHVVSHYFIPCLLISAIVIEMENLGVTDFKNLIFDGIVDLSGTTVNFCKSVLNLVNDFFGFYVPELLAVFVDCFCDLFQHMVAVYTEALKRDDNLPMVESIRGDAIFLVDTVLPSIGKKINREAGIEIGDLAEQHRRLEIHCVFIHWFQVRVYFDTDMYIVSCVHTYMCQGLCMCMYSLSHWMSS